MKPSLFVDESNEELDDSGLASARMEVDSSSEHDEDEVGALTECNRSLVSNMLDPSHALQLDKAEHRSLSLAPDPEASAHSY